MDRVTTTDRGSADTSAESEMETALRETGGLFFYVITSTVFDRTCTQGAGPAFGCLTSRLVRH